MYSFVIFDIASNKLYDFCDKCLIKLTLKTMTTVTLFKLEGFKV